MFIAAVCVILLIPHLFGIFWPSPHGQGRLLKISMVTSEIPNYRRHDPSKGEGTPAIHKKVKIGSGERGGKFDLTLLNQPPPSLHTRSIAKIWRNFRMTGMPKLQHGK